MLLKKIDKSKQFLEEAMHLFRCPKCNEPYIKMEGYQLTCENRHQVGLSKKGTLFFLEHPVKTGYDKEMLTHRQQMIMLGMYQPMIEKIAKVLQKDQVETVLDIGCGEGSFLAAITKLGVEGKKIGFDISKDGIALASEQPIDAFWCVADLTNLPFRENSITHLLNIFSPSHYEEFHRVMKKNGKVIKIIPEEKYLQELREVFYEEDESKQNYSNQKVLKKFKEEMTLVHEERITYSFSIPAEHYPDLLKMSPLHWSASEKAKQKSLEKKVETITIDVRLLVGEK